jgi:hypothetical protein
MTLTLNPDARQLATFEQPTWIHLRVSAGTVQLGESQQDVAGGDGLTVTAADGIVSLNWNRGQLWAAGDATPAVVRIIIP